MKNFVLCALIFLSLAFLSGCEKEQIIQIKQEVILPPTVMFEASQDSIIKGSSVVISWKIIGEFDSLVSDLDIKNMRSGALKVFPNKDTVYRLSFFYQDGMEESKLPVVVLPEGNDKVICYFPWKTTKKEYSLTLDGQRENIDIPLCKKDDRLIFSADHIVLLNKGTLVCQGVSQYRRYTWSFLDENTLKIGTDLTSEKTILSFSEERIIWRYKTEQGRWEYETLEPDLVSQ